MLAGKWSCVLLGLLLVLSLSEARSVDTQPPGKSDGEGDDYLDDYTGVNEDSIGIGAEGRVVLEDIFGSGLNVEGETTLKEGTVASRREDNVGKERSVASRRSDNIETSAPGGQQPSTGDSPLNVDVEGTIERVEKILAANPDLPRLSRGEILEIYRNITSGNTGTSQDPPRSTTTTPKPRDESKKSLLVVLPFNAGDMKDSSMEELFTKRPVTQIIGAEFEIPVKVVPPHRPNDISHEHGSENVNPSPVYKPSTAALHSAGAKVGRPTTNHYRQTIDNYNRTRPTTKPVYTPTRQTYAQPPPRHHNHAPAPRPTQQPSDNHEDNAINQNREPASTQRPSLVQYEINKRKKPHQPAIAQYQDVNPFRPMPAPDSPTHANHRPAGQTIKPHADVNDNEVIYGQTARPHANTNQNQQTQASNEVVLTGGFRPVTNQGPHFTTNHVGEKATDKPPVRSDVQTVLASLGLFPDKGGQHVVYDASTTTTVKPRAESLTPDMVNVLESLGLLPAASEVQPVVHTGDSSPAEEPATSHVQAGSYSGFKPLPSVVGSADGDKDVSGELKRILADLGLVPGSDLGQGTLDFDSLDQIDVSGRPRGQKAMPATDKRNNIKEGVKKGDKKAEGMSEEMRGILENLGLVTTTSKSTTSKSTTQKSTTAPGHIFNPVVHAASLDDTKSQLERLNQLVSTIQLLAKDNETFTQAEIEELTAAFNLGGEGEGEGEIAPQEDKPLPLDQLLDGPDPLTTDELIDLYIKNEVKRQQPDNVTEAVGTLSTTEVEVVTPQTTSTTTSTTEGTEERVPTLTDFGTGGQTGTGDGGASISDLEDSFGGGGEEETADQTEGELPQKKPNGLYFLLDWNSFLEVGEERKNKTTIRFTPKVGNPKNFLPVTVP